MRHLQELPGGRAGVQSRHLREGQPRPRDLCGSLRLSACTRANASSLQVLAAQVKSPARACPTKTWMHEHGCCAGAQSEAVSQWHGMLQSYAS